MVYKIIAGLIGGIIPAVLAMMVIGLPFASNSELSDKVGPWAFIATWVIILILSIMAATGKKAWGRVFLVTAMFCFALPLSSFLFTGAGISEAASSSAEHSGAAMAGAAIGGGLVTMVSGFIGFFMGVVFLILGLSLNKDKQVVIIRERD